MELYLLKENINVFCVTVKSFPEGIAEAFKILLQIHPSICERSLYGIFHQDKNGNMIYKAAVAESYKGEGKQYGCETFIITKGTYLIEKIVDYMNKTDNIPGAFQKLGADPRVNTSFPSVEWYKDEKEVTCMVKLK